MSASAQPSPLELQLSLSCTHLPSQLLGRIVCEVTGLPTPHEGHEESPQGISGEVLVDRIAKDTMEIGVEAFAKSLSPEVIPQLFPHSSALSVSEVELQMHLRGAQRVFLESPADAVQKAFSDFTHQPPPNGKASSELSSMLLEEILITGWEGLLSMLSDEVIYAMGESWKIAGVHPLDGQEDGRPALVEELVLHAFRLKEMWGLKEMDETPPAVSFSLDISDIAPEDASSSPRTSSSAGTKRKAESPPPPSSTSSSSTTTIDDSTSSTPSSRTSKKKARLARENTMENTAREAAPILNDPIITRGRLRSQDVTPSDRLLDFINRSDQVAQLASLATIGSVRATSMLETRLALPNQAYAALDDLVDLKVLSTKQLTALLKKNSNDERFSGEVAEHEGEHE